MQGVGEVGGIVGNAPHRAPRTHSLLPGYALTLHLAPRTLGLTVYLGQGLPSAPRSYSSSDSRIPLSCIGFCGNGAKYVRFTTRIAQAYDFLNTWSISDQTATSRAHRQGRTRPWPRRDARRRNGGRRRRLAPKFAHDEAHRPCRNLRRPSLEDVPRRRPLWLRSVSPSPTSHDNRT